MVLIMGNSVATAEQMEKYLISKNPNPKFTGNITILQFCQKFIDVCKSEGVRGDVAFAQACKETGFFKFGGDVKYNQNNFCGLGATGSVSGCSFKNVDTGILAQAQHLKTYATKDKLNMNNVDPRRTDWFIKAKGGTAPYVEQLGGTWAVPGYDTKKYFSLSEANSKQDSYGFQIVNILEDILSIKNKPKYYRVQTGAFRIKSNADQLVKNLEACGYKPFVIKFNNLYKVQLGAFSIKNNAVKFSDEIKQKGFSVHIVYE